MYEKWQAQVRIPALAFARVRTQWLKAPDLRHGFLSLTPSASEGGMRCFRGHCNLHLLCIRLRQVLFNVSFRSSYFPQSLL
jgi:hypothetical protein